MPSRCDQREIPKEDHQEISGYTKNKKSKFHKSSIQISKSSIQKVHTNGKSSIRNKPLDLLAKDSTFVLVYPHHQKQGNHEVSIVVFLSLLLDDSIGHQLYESTNQRSIANTNRLVSCTNKRFLFALFTRP